MNCCPVCGHAIHSLPPDLVDLIGGLSLPRKERLVADALIAAYPRRLTAVHLAARLYDDERVDAPAWPEAVVQSHVSKLKAKLNAIGFDMESRRFLGYRLVLPSGRISPASPAPRQVGETA